MIGNALIRWSKTLVERIRIFLWSIKGAVDAEGGRSLKVEQLFVGFTCNNFCHSGAQVEKELKMAGEKKKCNFGSSPLFTGVNNYLSVELSQ